jgi:signal peptidase II
MNIKVATLFAETSSGDLFGTVADMFCFLRWQGTLSEWIPLIGGDFFTFFQYIYIIMQMLLFLWMLLFF